MIKQLLFAPLIFTLGWYAGKHFSYTTEAHTTPPLSNEKPALLTNPEQTEDQKIQNQDTPLSKQVSIDSSSTSLKLLHALLANHRFDDALSLMLETADLETEQRFRHVIETYLTTTLQETFETTLPYFERYLIEIPDSLIRKVLISAYSDRRFYDKALVQLQEFETYNTTEEDQDYFTETLHGVSSDYMAALKEKKRFNRLLSFLDEMILEYPYDNYFKFALAETYVSLGKPDEITAVAEDLSSDENYASQFEALLEQRYTPQKTVRDYRYLIPLKRSGSHFLAETVIGGETFELMVDTGASNIFIDSDKTRGFRWLKSGIRVQTAGGEITAELYEADRLRIGQLEIHTIEILSAPFKDQHADGLLGMNFFKQFVFFLDQQESLLYLDPIE